jgi:hypothetical protein
VNFYQFGSRRYCYPTPEDAAITARNVQRSSGARNARDYTRALGAWGVAYAQSADRDVEAIRHLPSVVDRPAARHYITIGVRS